MSHQVPIQPKTWTQVTNRVALYHESADVVEVTVTENDIDLPREVNFRIITSEDPVGLPDTIDGQTVMKHPLDR